jgi:hypothetical protein
MRRPVVSYLDPAGVAAQVSTRLLRRRNEYHGSGLTPHPLDGQFFTRATFDAVEPRLDEAGLRRADCTRRRNWRDRNRVVPQCAQASPPASRRAASATSRPRRRSVLRYANSVDNLALNSKKLLRLEGLVKDFLNALP